MNSLHNTKTKHIITVCLICLTVAAGLLAAILGADRALDFLGEVVRFTWERFKGFVIGVFIVVPLWLLWWAVSAIIDKIRETKAKREAAAMKPVCPACGTEVLAGSGRFCRRCGWDFMKPITAASKRDGVPDVQKESEVRNIPDEGTET